jgi:hypothetical protein
LRQASRVIAVLVKKREKAKGKRGGEREREREKEGEGEGPYLAEHNRAITADGGVGRGERRVGRVLKAGAVAELHRAPGPPLN